MTADATYIMSNTTGVNYDQASSSSPTHIPLGHDASSISQYQANAASYTLIDSHSQLSRSASSETTIHHPLMAINTSFNRGSPSTDSAPYYSQHRSHLYPLDRRRAHSDTSTASIESAQASSQHTAYHFHYSAGPVDGSVEAYENQPSATTCSESFNSSGSQSNDEQDTPLTTNNETRSGQRPKRRRPLRTEETLLTEKSARDKLKMGFDMLKESLPEHIRMIRCGRANFLGETADWINGIRQSHADLEKENQTLREMIRRIRETPHNCSCGAGQPLMEQQLNPTLQHPIPTYYNPDQSYAQVVNSSF